MNIRTTLRDLFAHNDWARDKLMSLADGLTDEPLDRPFEMGSGSLRKTLHHLWAAERVWLDRWLERPVPKLPELVTATSVRANWDQFRTTADERERFLDTAGPDGESRPITFTNTKGETYTFPLGDLMLHVVNHGVHHRAQALNMLRHAGVKVPGLDYIFYRLEYPTVPQPLSGLQRVRKWGFTASPSPGPPARFDVDSIRSYFAYGDWANARLIDLASRLDDALLDRPFEMGIGSLRKTLLHIRDAEQNWVDNWTRGSTPGFATLPVDTSIAALRDLWRETIERRFAFLEARTADDLAKPLIAQPAEGVQLSFRLGETMLQLGGHGTHHRAQALNMLRHLGSEAPGVDYTVWLRKVGGRGRSRPAGT